MKEGCFKAKDNMSADINLPKKHIVIERNVKSVHLEKYCGHSIAFPAIMDVLKALLIKNIKPINYQDDDFNYGIQMGISGEGFGFMTNIIDIINIFGKDVLSDSFIYDGITFHTEECISCMKDIKKRVDEHLSEGKPIILINNRKNPVIVLAFGSETRDKYVYKYIDESLRFLIYIDRIGESVSKNQVIDRALVRGYTILNNNTKITKNKLEKYHYQNWISRFDNDRNYISRTSGTRKFVYEKNDLSERRLYLSRFFEECERFYGYGKFKNAINASNMIYLKLKDISTIIEEEGDIRSRGVRDRIISIIEECAYYDTEIKNTIKKNIGSKIKDSCFANISELKQSVY